MEKHGVQILGTMKPEYNSVLTPAAVAFVGHIQRKFGFRVLDLLQKRNERQAKYASFAFELAIDESLHCPPMHTCWLHAGLMQVKSQTFCQRQSRFVRETGRFETLCSWEKGTNIMPCCICQSATRKTPPFVQFAGGPTAQRPSGPQSGDYRACGS